MKKLMKKMRNIISLALCLMLLQGIVIPVSVPVEAATATVKNGLVRSGADYYYYVNNQMAVNKWVNIQGKSSAGNIVTYRYYFGADGKAYRAPKLKEYSYNIAMKKIGGKWYGFFNNGRMVTSAGVFTDWQGRVWVFDAKGVYNATKSVKIRNAVTKNDLKTIVAMLGTAKKVDISTSCLELDSTDRVYTYAFSVLFLVRNNKTKANRVIEIMCR